MFAVTEWSALTDGFAAELVAALPVALAAVGLFIGVIMAYKLVVWMLVGAGAGGSYGGSESEVNEVEARRESEI